MSSTTTTVASRFGDIAPSFATAFGASVSIGLAHRARKAEARAVSAAARRPRGALPSGEPSLRRAPLPVEIATPPAVPHSRVCIRVGDAHDARRSSDPRSY
jgi:hypothetical protein